MSPIKPGWRRSASIAALCVAGLPSVSAGDFAQAYQAALQNDAKFQSARYTLESGLQALPLARAAILPTVSATISDMQVQGTQDIETAGTTTSNKLDYRSPSQSISARVPLINAAGVAGTRVAGAQMEAAQSQYEAQKADLLDRLTIAFLQRMLAEDAFNATHVQMQAVIEQRNLMRKRLERGEGTKTEVAEARASVSTVQAQWADARDQVTNTRATLAQMTGEQLTDASEKAVRLADDFKPPALEPADLTPWIAMALETSPTLRAKRQLAAAAAQAVARADAGHLPRLDLVASVSNARNESASSLNQTVNQRAVGLQLSIPIYSGGQVVAQAKAANAELARADAEVLAEQRAIELDVTRLYRIVRNGATKLESYVDALEASILAAEGARRGLESGLRTNADVIEALRKAAQAQKDLAQARYDHVLQRIRLFNRAGMAAEKVVEQVDALLKREEGSSPAPTAQ